MVKQKVVIKVPMNDSKSRSKALRIVVGVSGVDSAALGGNDKSQIEVTGEVDAVKLATLLRKNVGHAELVGVNEVEVKKEDKKEDKKEVMYVQSYSYPMMPSRYVCYDAQSQYYQDPWLCSIL